MLLFVQPKNNIFVFSFLVFLSLSLANVGSHEVNNLHVFIYKNCLGFSATLERCFEFKFENWSTLGDCHSVLEFLICNGDRLARCVRSQD